MLSGILESVGRNGIAAVLRNTRALAPLAESGFSIGLAKIEEKR
jgi:hypothetical protein